MKHKLKLKYANVRQASKSPWANLLKRFCYRVELVVLYCVIWSREVWHLTVTRDVTLASYVSYNFNQTARTNLYYCPPQVLWVTCHELMTCTTWTQVPRSTMLTKHKKTLFVNTNENDVDSEHYNSYNSQSLRGIGDGCIHHSSPLYLAVNRGADSIHIVQ